jgi:hypothetical protein
MFTIHPVRGDTRQVPPQRVYRIHLRGVGEQVSGPEGAAYDSSMRTLNLSPVTLKSDEEFSIRFQVK